MSRTQEIFERLRELNLPSEAWALFAELENIKTMHSATEAAAGYRAGVDDAEAERKRKDRDRKKEASRKFQETPVRSMNSSAILQRYALPTTVVAWYDFVGIERDSRGFQ